MAFIIQYCGAYCEQCNTVYHESFEAEKFRGFRGFLLLRETFFHEIFQLLLKSGRL